MGTHSVLGAQSLEEHLSFGNLGFGRTTRPLGHLQLARVHQLSGRSALHLRACELRLARRPLQLRRGALGLGARALGLSLVLRALGPRGEEVGVALPKLLPVPLEREHRPLLEAPKLLGVLLLEPLHVHRHLGGHLGRHVRRVRFVPRRLERCLGRLKRCLALRHLGLSRLRLPLALCHRLALVLEHPLACLEVGIGVRAAHARRVKLLAAGLELGDLRARRRELGIRRLRLAPELHVPLGQGAHLGLQL